MTGCRFTHIASYVWLRHDAIHKELASYSTKNRKTKPQLLSVVSRACGMPPSWALHGPGPVQQKPQAAVSVLQGTTKEGAGLCRPAPAFPGPLLLLECPLLQRGCPRLAGSRGRLPPTPTLCTPDPAPPSLSRCFSYLRRAPAPCFPSCSGQGHSFSGSG